MKINLQLQQTILALLQEQGYDIFSAMVAKNRLEKELCKLPEGKHAFKVGNKSININVIPSQKNDKY